MENARLLGELRQRTDEVAELNRGLEARVAEQVEELGRVGRLKWFLAPQLAELIVSHCDENILESHRREIVVVFCDLRATPPSPRPPNPTLGPMGGWVSAVRAQQKAMPEIGWLSTGSPGSALEPFIASLREGLAETGWVERQNVAIEYRRAEGQYDRLPALAADLVSRKVDLIVTSGGTPPALAAKNATSTIPIVFSDVGDPVGFGLVASLAQPHRLQQPHLRAGAEAARDAL